MAFVDDQDPVEQFAAQGSNHPFADRVRPGRCGWIGADLNAVGGEDRVEGPGDRESGSRSRNVMVLAHSEMSIMRLRAAWVVHAPVGCAVTPSRCARRELCSTAIRA